MWNRVIIGALGGLTAAISKLLAIDTKIMASFLNHDLIEAADELIVTVYIHMPLLIILGAIVAAVTDESIRMKIFAIGVSAPALVAPWLTQPPKFIDQPADTHNQRAFVDFLITPAYAQENPSTDKISELEALQYLIGLKDPTQLRDEKQYWVVVGSFKNLEDAENRLQDIVSTKPELKPFIGQRKPDNEFYPVIVGGTDAKLPYDQALKLKALAEKSAGVAPEGAYLSDFAERLPPIKTAQ